MFDTNKCTVITDYEGDHMYQLVKNPVSGKWEDQTAQSLTKNYKHGFDCPCKTYLMENCDKKFKNKLYNVTRNKFSYFISQHINSTSHKEWISHKNTITSNLESKSNKELVEQIDVLHKLNRKDKVDFRGYLDIRDKEILSLKEQLELQKQLIKELRDQKEQLETLIPKPAIGNLIDLI
tara:strand:+ start:1830 stop:2366 length:537 start_codon:yes stop_codon:yes gene_type:complete